jgi:hypothetical protein
MDAEGKEASQA